MIDVQQQLNQMTVYIKTVSIEGMAPSYWVFGSEGEPVSGFAMREAAFACARIHDLIPHSLH